MTTAPDNRSCRFYASSITAMIAYVPATWADEIKRAYPISYGLALAIHYRHIDRLSLSDEARWTLLELTGVITHLSDNSKSPWCAHEAMNLALQTTRDDRPAGTPLTPFTPKRACCQDMGAWVDLAADDSGLPPGPVFPDLPSSVPNIGGVSDHGQHPSRAHRDPGRIGRGLPPGHARRARLLNPRDRVLAGSLGQFPRGKLRLHL